VISCGFIGGGTARNLLEMPVAPGTMQGTTEGAMKDSRRGFWAAVLHLIRSRLGNRGEVVPDARRYTSPAPRPLPPLVLSWPESDHLPFRRVRAPARAGRLTGLESPPWHQSGPIDRPFDFCGHIARLCADIALRCDELKHLDVSRLLIGITQARTGRTHGLQARVTPLRFNNGELTRLRRGIAYQVQRYVVGQHEMLYLVTFCLPRFLEQDFDQKFITLFHELYHISPAFDGDLRRHEGRYAIHSHSQKCYDDHMAHLARAYLAGRPDPALHGFMRLSFRQLEKRHGSVVGVMVPRPKLVPVGRL